MSDNVTLKPCPFCGMSIFDQECREADGLYYVSCGGCGAETMGGDTLEHAQAAWNTRVQQSGQTEAEGCVFCEEIPDDHADRAFLEDNGRMVCSMCIAATVIRMGELARSPHLNATQGEGA